MRDSWASQGAMADPAPPPEAPAEGEDQPKVGTKVATRDINFGILIKVPQKVDLKIP